jgi:hypothetical protein
MNQRRPPPAQRGIVSVVAFRSSTVSMGFGYETAVYFECQTQFGDIPRPREESAGTFLDSAQSVADRVGVAIKYFSRTAHGRSPLCAAEKDASTVDNAPAPPLHRPHARRSRPIRPDRICGVAGLVGRIRYDVVDQHNSRITVRVITPHRTYLAAIVVGRRLRWRTASQQLRYQRVAVKKILSDCLTVRLFCL